MAEKRLTKEIAEQFLADDESVDLNEFTELDDAAAQRLSKYKGYCLGLPGLTSLSDAAAESLGKHEGIYLRLDGLTSLSDAVAESLVKHKAVPWFGPGGSPEKRSCTRPDRAISAIGPNRE